MRYLAIAIVGVAAFLTVPGAGFAQDIQVGPGGVRVYPHHDHHGYGADCRSLRQACLHKGELGEQGRGNCQRYREVCH
jgi:hypothetical protein